MKKKKTEIFINKPVYLGIPILVISKIVMYDYLKLAITLQKMLKRDSILQIRNPENQYLNDTWIRW